VCYAIKDLHEADPPIAHRDIKVWVEIEGIELNDITI
jgi:hypothetical protein